MKLKYIFLASLILCPVFAVYPGVSNSYATTKGRCLLVASKKKNVALITCRRTRNKACAKKAIAAYKIAAAKCSTKKISVR